MTTIRPWFLHFCAWSCSGDLHSRPSQPPNSDMDSKGSKLYTAQNSVQNDSGTANSSSAINANAGALGKQVDFWNTDYDKDHSVFSDGEIALINDRGVPNSVIAIFPNGSNPNANPTSFACDSSVLAICGDNIGPSLWMHPSGAYLFVYDQTLNEVPILYISLPLQELEVSGGSIPGDPSTLAFGPDGLLVYAIEGSEILVYVFNPHSGLLTARILPVQ